MASYNRVNDSYASQNSKLLNGLLKTELGFQGVVVSDWFAQHTGIASANAGLDMAMPDSPYWEGNLTLAVANGSVSQSRLDDMATRILATWYKLAPFENPGSGMPIDLLAPHEFTNARDPASKSTLLQGAVEGHVLVKNVNNALPLHAPPTLSLFGYDAFAYLENDPPVGGNGKWNLGYQPVTFTDGEILEFFLAETNDTVPAAAYNGTMISGGGSGACTPAYVDAPYDAFQRQAYDDGTFLTWDFQNLDPSVEGASSACIVFINVRHGPPCAYLIYVAQY